MDYQDIEVRKSDGVEIVTLNRPERLNALRFQSFFELIVAFEDAQRDPDVRALVLTGAGRGFCSGMDTAMPGTPDEPLPDFAALLGLRALPGDRSALLRRLNDLAMQRLEAFTMPTIAAVNGVAVGAGFSMALACDIRYASTAARFQCIFAKRGATIHAGMSYYLPRIVGAARALELLVADEEVHAPEAERIGLVNKVFEPDELLPAATRLAAKIAAQSPAVIEAGKRLIHEDLSPGTLAGKMEQEWWAATVSRP